MKAHIFDLDVIIKIDQKVWLIDKTRPSIPILKLSLSDLHLYQSGIFRAHGNNIKFNGIEYWLPNDFMGKIKVKVKNIDSKMSNLGLSMQEFLNKELIENLEYTILEDNFHHLKNSEDDIYVICPKRDRLKYEKFLEKLSDKLAELGLKIKAYYHIDEKFYDKENHKTSFNKVKIVVQHLIGFKTENNLLTDEEITKYDEVSFYDNSSESITLCKNINSVLQSLIDKCKDSNLVRMIKDVVDTKPVVNVVEVTTNKLFRFKESKVELRISHIKSFESFVFLKSTYLKS